jgi:hypothetical protein
MSRFLTATAALAIAIGLTDGSTAFAGPSMVTNWTATTLNQKQCMQRAERVMRDAGLGKNLDIVGQSVFGQDGGYTSVMRCISDKGLVYFVVGGPSLDGSKKRMRSLFDNF